MTGQLEHVEQLALLPEPEPGPPQLTDRQAAVLDLVERATHEGITADEAGALLHSLKEGRWAHTTDDRCEFCGRDGKAVLEALRTKGLVTYRRARGNRPGGWTTVGQHVPASEPAPVPPDHDGAGPVPFNAFPKGF